MAVTDFMKAVPDQVARWVPAPFISLGTDGFGRSDTREALRRYFETDAAHVVVAALDGLRQAGEGKAEEVEDAIRRYGIDPDDPAPARLLSRCSCLVAALSRSWPEPPLTGSTLLLCSIFQATQRLTNCSPRTHSPC